MAAMRIFLTGAACVGKTTIGRRLAGRLNVAFFDLDEEVEAFFGTSIERLQKKFLTMHTYREEAAKVLRRILERPDSRDSVIALPPSGLMGGYWRVMKKTTGIIIVLDDRPENILERIRFFDIDSKPVDQELTPREKRWYLSEMKKDLAYFGKTYGRAHLKVDIAGLDVEGVVNAVKAAAEPFREDAGI
jgi:shikimate kinase